MVNVYGLKQEIKGLSDLDGKAKLARAKNILVKVNEAEQEIARDFSIPFDTVRDLRGIIPELLATISRTEAGLKRRAANA